MKSWFENRSTKLFYENSIILANRYRTTDNN